MRNTNPADDLERIQAESVEKVREVLAEWTARDEKPGKSTRWRRGRTDAVRRFSKLFDPADFARITELQREGREVSRRNRGIPKQHKEKRAGVIYAYWDWHRGYYVGSTDDVYRRHREHQRDVERGGWKAEKHRRGIAYFLVIRVLDRIADARKVEGVLVRIYQPTLNKVGIHDDADELANPRDTISGGMEDRRSKRRTARRRPPQWQRASNAEGMATADLLSLGRAGYGAKKDGREGYDVLYARTQVSRGTEGPICIYQRPYYFLLAKYLAKKRTRVVRLLFLLHRRTEFPEYQLRTIVEDGGLLLGKEKPRARQKVSILINCRGAPSRARIVVTWRYQWERDGLRKLRSQILAESHPVIRKHLAAVIAIRRVMAPRMRYFTRTAVSAARKVGPEVEAATSFRGVTMKAADFSLSDPLPPGSESSRHLAEQARILQRASCKRVKFQPDRAAQEKELLAHPLREAAELAEDELSQGRVLLQVDKVKELGLFVGRLLYQQMCCRIILHERSLEVMPLSHADALKQMNTAIREWNAEEGRRPQHRLEEVTELAYVYILPKGKNLVVGESGDVWFKDVPEAKLFRKIVAQVRAIRGKNRATQRRCAATAEETLARVLTKGRENCCLTEAAASFKRKAAQLRGCTGKCVRCGVGHTPSGIVVDAVVFFERVCIQHMRDQIDYICRQPKCTDEDAANLEFLFFNITALRYSSLGSRAVLRQDQNRGTPIGGILSKTACSIAMTAAEDAAFRGGTVKPAELAMERYVDDSQNVSSVFCQACCEKVVEGVYAGVEVEVDRELKPDDGTPGGYSMRWLHMSSLIEVDHKSGRVNVSTRPVLKPLGPSFRGLHDIEYYRSVFFSRFQSILHTITSTGEERQSEIYLHTVNDLKQWMRNGFGLPTVLEIVRCSRKVVHDHPRVFRLLTTTISACISKVRDLHYRSESSRKPRKMPAPDNKTDRDSIWKGNGGRNAEVREEIRIWELEKFKEKTEKKEKEKKAIELEDNRMNRLAASIRDGVSCFKSTSTTPDANPATAASATGGASNEEVLRKIAEMRAQMDQQNTQLQGQIQQQQTQFSAFVAEQQRTSDNLAQQRMLLGQQFQGQFTQVLNLIGGLAGGGAGGGIAAPAGGAAGGNGGVGAVGGPGVGGVAGGGAGGGIAAPAWGAAGGNGGVGAVGGPGIGGVAMGGGAAAGGGNGVAPAGAAAVAGGGGAGNPNPNGGVGAVIAGVANGNVLQGGANAGAGAGAGHLADLHTNKQLLAQLLTGQERLRCDFAQNNQSAPQHLDQLSRPELQAIWLRIHADRRLAMHLANPNEPQVPNNNANKATLIAGVVRCFHRSHDLAPV